MQLSIYFFQMILSLNFIMSDISKFDSGRSIAQENPKSESLVEMWDEMGLLFGWAKNMDKYSHDSCSKRGEHTTKLFFEATSVYWKCNDGSISFAQPSSTGYKGWNGMCGETGIANVFKMTCGEGWHPDGLIHSLASDYTPGTRPSSVEYVLNELSGKSHCGNKAWSYYNTADSARDYIESIIDGLKSDSLLVRTRSNGKKIKRAPVMTLLKLPEGKVLHWVTVVDIEGYSSDQSIGTNKKCFAFVNQWGKQYKVPCSHLAGMALNTRDVMLNAVGKYVRIKQI